MLDQNVYAKTIERVVKSLGPINHVCTQFERELSLIENQDYHTYPSFIKDLNTIAQLLAAEKVSTKCMLLIKDDHFYRIYIGVIL